MSRGPTPRSLWDRFWAKVAIPDIPDSHLACWPWTGAKTTRRGGKGWVPHIRDEGGKHGKVLVATRVSLEWSKGPPPTRDHEAGHTCPTGENNLCVNPGHLAWQTREENEQWKRKMWLEKRERALGSRY